MAELLLRVRCDVMSDVVSDVAVEVTEHHTVGELVQSLADHVGVAIDPCRHVLGLPRIGAVVGGRRRVVELDIRTGDEVVLGAVPPTRAPPQRSPRPLVLDITAGPDNGRSVELAIGATTIGRSSDADITLVDRSVSRRHATLSVDGAGVVTVVGVSDARNGIAIDGTPVPLGKPTAVQPGNVIALGGTRAVIRRVAGSEAGDEVGSDEVARPVDDGFGFVGFHRTPYRPVEVTGHEPEPVGPIPRRGEPRRLQLIAAVAPLAAGLTMYAMTSNAQFLLFTLISPVVMVGTFLDDRRTGRRSFRRDLASFRTMLEGRRAGFEQLAAREQAERLAASPDVASLVRRAQRRSVDLWERGRTTDDFLRLRLGLGDDVTRFDVPIANEGEDDLRAEAAEALDGVRRLTHVPITVDLGREVLGVHGPADLVRGVAASLLVQAATLHSPDDLAIVAAVTSRRELSWSKWLPHLRSVVSPVGGAHLADTTAGADSLIAELIAVADFRLAASSRGSVDPWPRVLAVIDASVAAEPAAVARLLDVASMTGIAVVWIADRAADIPRHATRVLRLRHGDGASLAGHLWATDPSIAPSELEVEHVRSEVARRAALALAPVRDASTASLASSIPRVAPLLDVLGWDEPAPDRVAAAWHAVDGCHLRFPVGLTADGPLELDLVDDGPHTLIGGTSGAGKSELLQSMVAALAARHSPARLNFLFIDYKGGAASQVFNRLPHTVGYVTNLSAALALRALTSLRAELNRRMAVMEGRAADLAEMLARHPAEAPPSLVIVVDEFATLVNEVPEFVAGIVDVAQRGRSLGIHLVLATQRPTGAVNENILANTNLRISLRMLDRAESSAIIDSPDAAAIPVPLRGRGLARLGPRRLVEFQSAYAGAPFVLDTERLPIGVAAFDRTDATARVVMTPGRPTGGSQLGALLDAIVAANDVLAVPPPPRPWRDVLPEVVTLDAVAADSAAAAVTAQPGRFVAIGMLDAPERQEQRPALVDLESDGGLLVFGSGGTGKTTLLRSIAVGVEQCGGRARTLAFDFASRGLRALADLPSVVDVATGDDLEAVSRHLLVLERELDRRRHLLAAAGAEHLTAYVEGGEQLERIVVLIDGFAGLADALGGAGPSLMSAAGEMWSERVQRLVVEGRQVGIHVVIASDRRGAVPSRIQSAIGARVVLRHADPQAYADFGIRPDRAEVLDEAPGRALLDGRTVVQLASVSKDASARAQAAAIAEIARATGSRRDEPHPLASRALPSVIDDVLFDVSAELAATPTGAIVGLADITSAPAVLDVEWSHAVVAGPPRSGRSTALAAFVAGWHDRSRLVVVGGRSSPLAGIDLPTSRTAFGSASEVGVVLDRAANLAAVASPGERLVVVVDDLDDLDDMTLAPVLARLVACDSVRLVAALDSRSLVGYTASAAIGELRRARRMLILQPDDPAEFVQLTGVRLPARPGLRFLPGRGVLVADRVPTVVHVADRVAAYA